MSWSRFGPTVPVDPAAASVWQLPQVDSNTFIPAFSDTPLLEPPLLEVELLEVELLEVVFVAVFPDEDDVAVLDEDCVLVCGPADGVDEDLLPPPQAATAMLARAATATAAARPETVLLIALLA